jgi:DUF4097 and DUF4098 domain-containing protein YvlB
MRKLCYSVVPIAVILLLSAAALAEDWKKDYTVSGSPVLQVETNDASIHVNPGSGNTISARVIADNYSIGSGGVRVTEQQMSDSVRIQVKVPQHHVSFSFSKNDGVRIEVSVPQNTKLQLTSSDGSLHVSGVRAPVNLVTSDGSIHADDLDGALVARTSDGSITVSGRFDNLDLSTSDGHVRCDARAGSRVNGAWNLRTSDGSIELNVPADLAADLEAWTSDGRVAVNVPMMVEGSQARNRVRGKLNGGGGLLKLHTSDGSITVNKL